MFAGIVETLGEVTHVGPARAAHGGTAVRIEIRLGALLDGLPLGASMAVNGVCLTLAESRDGIGGFDVVPETLRRTTLGALRPGDPVNVERSLRVGDRIDGHFVQGHVDAVGVVNRIANSGGDYKLWIATDAGALAHIIPKGSIALDGTSMTVVDVTADAFSVVVVPTTWQRTTLGRRRPGDRVNIETDILVRTILGRFPLGEAAAARGVTWETLRANGFVS
jgi:riboflavin synthase